jgi:enterochelin esterase-like enzyme
MPRLNMKPHCKLHITFFAYLLCLVASVLQPADAQETSAAACSTAAKANQKIEVSFPASASSKPITGRVIVILTRNGSREPRLQIGWWNQRIPFFGADVNQLKPGEPAIIDPNTLGFPLKSLCELPSADYYAQALLNVYTEFHRSDGHTIWAHMDQWEGQQFNLSPGNLSSEVQSVHLDPAQGFDIKLSLSRVIPPIQMPADTSQVKHVKIESKLLSQFWGRPIYLGATVLLPKGYAAHPGVHYPVIYIQDHFNLNAPFHYSEQDGSDEDPAPFQPRMTGYEFHQQWDSARFPRMIAVTFQHPTPYFDDSYAVNSANNGPYGDALLTELVPYIESRFRTIRKYYARVLVGGSTGGWESLALQVFHPEFFGGTWTFYPDPIDFTRYQLVDIYKDKNAFLVPGYDPPIPERPLERTVEGQMVFTVRQMSQMEEVLGTHGRSGQQLEAWEAVYGPVGDDGYPKPVWNKLTGEIDHTVAEYMRDHSYDLRDYLQKNWDRIGSQLVGKIHIYCGDMDNYYLNLAVYKMEVFLSHSKNPYYAGSFEYGRPMKGHGWQPMNNAQLVRIMADYISKHAPKGDSSTSWHYQ